MQSFQEFCAALTSYVIALFSIFADHSSTIVSLLGFVLLCARLIVELPKAYKVIARKFTDERD